jgi:predicted ArsR family transcriptional regulator
VSDRERRSWDAYLITGTYRQAAIFLRIHEDTVRRHITMLKAEHGVRTNAQLADALARADSTAVHSGSS